ncbi:MAG: radical SAM protein [Clostridiales bacterium]|nr:radical SAM protein [Clostridiales bacterium]
MEGKVHSFESLAAVDGTGLRYGIFFVGCPLRCAYCHNPDTWNAQGTPYTAEELLNKIIRFVPYFKETGGVTFSGGEPLLQAEFLLELTALLNEHGIRYVVDTSGSVPLTASAKQVLKGAQTVLLDVKFASEKGYQAYTGGSITPVMETLRFLQQENVPTVVRTVVVPNINDSKERLAPYVDIVRGFPCIKEYELLAFHTMGFQKYEKLGIQNPLAGTPALPPDRLAELQAFVNEKLKGE